MRLRRLLPFLGLVGLGLVGLAPSAQAATVGSVASVSAGGSHTCGINNSKNLYCWGSNGDGQIGNGTTGGDRPVPIRIGGIGVWAGVTAGGAHSCGVTTGKNLHCWGSNSHGQIGDGSMGTPRPSPTRIGGIGAWANASSGGLHTCGITTGRNLYCWGSNSHGEIGDGSTGTPRPAPTKIGGSGVWSNVAAGGDHTCGITTAKNLYCWGDNEYGQIGNGASGTDRPAPTKIGGSGVWALVAAGAAHTCGITTAKNLYCWGYNGTGQIGDGSSGNERPALTKIGGGGVWASVTAGKYHTCGITVAKNLYCWGYRANGQVGDGIGLNSQTTPKRIGGSGVWVRTDVGTSHSCGITAATNLYCWGYNGPGAVGDGTSGNDRGSPTRVP